MPDDAISLQAIIGFRLTTSDLPRLVQFYRHFLGFAPRGGNEVISPAEMAGLGLQGAGSRQDLVLGSQVLSIDRFDAPGQPYPAGSDAASRRFQHLAIVVDDMAQAFAHVSQAVAISTDGPQALPVSSGGVIAFKFRDPDGHPLELLQFPPDAVPTAWRGRAAAGPFALGIDHSAISVAAGDVSAAFYADAGLKRGEGSHNRGVAQQRLDGLADADVEVVPMLSPRGIPHLELLAYKHQHCAPAPALRPNDVAATRIVWHGTGPAALQDPDGHWHQLEPPSEASG